MRLVTRAQARPPASLFRLVVASMFFTLAWAQSPDQQLARDIFKQLIDINTTDSVGDNTRAARLWRHDFGRADFRILTSTCSARSRARVTSWSAYTGRAPGGRFCLSVTSTWSKRNAPTGRLTRSSSAKWTAISTDAERRT